MKDRIPSFDNFSILEGSRFFYPGPNPTVDLVVFRDNKVLLIRRGKNSTAEAGKWAIPGGFHDSNTKKGESWRQDKETAEEAALRELKEETGLDGSKYKNKLVYVGVYEGGGRDPRDTDAAWTRSTVFAVRINETDGDNVKGLDDADKADWVEISKATKMKLAFDHNRILEDAIKKIK